MKRINAIIGTSFCSLLAMSSPGQISYFAGVTSGSGNTGQYNTGVGSAVLNGNNSGSSNSAFGFNAMKGNGGGSNNTAAGTFALLNNANANGNTAIGSNAMYSNTSGGGNTAVGNSSLYTNTGGSYNIGVGEFSLYRNTTGIANIGIGKSAMYNNTNGLNNISIGSSSLFSNSTGSANISVGTNSLYSNLTGSNNIAIGNSSANAFANYTRCTFVGNGADATVSGLTNATAIGNGATVNASNKVVIGNTNITSIGGQVGWTTYSDSRLKFYIRKSTLGLDFIKSLNPVTYQYTADGQKEILYTGLIAQEVAEAAAKAGVSFSAVDKNGEYWGIRYGELTVPLIKAVQEMEEQYQSRITYLEACITRLEKALESKDQGGAFHSGRTILYQCQPDPITAGISIPYYLPQPGIQAEIMIRDLNGNTIRNISLSGDDNGRVLLQAGSLTAGTYTYSLISEGHCTDTKLMVIAR